MLNGDQIQMISQKNFVGAVLDYSYENQVGIQEAKIICAKYQQLMGDKSFDYFLANP